MTEPQWQNPVDPTAPPAWTPPTWSNPPADPYGAAAPQYGTAPYTTPSYGAPNPPAAPASAPGYGYGYGAPPPSPYGGYQSPYQPAPKRSGGKIALIVILAVVVVAGLCTGGVLLLGNKSTKANAGAGTTTPTSGTPATSPATSPSTNGPVDPGKALYAKIVTPPADSHEYSLDKGVNGVFNAKQLADQTFDSSSAAGRLTTAGMIVAAGRDYVRPDGMEILVYLLEFKSPSGARSIYNYVISGRDDDKTVTGKFPVAGGKGYEWNTLDKLGNRRSEMYKIVGSVLILLNVYTPGDINDTTNLAMLSDQVAALS